MRTCRGRVTIAAFATLDDLAARLGHEIDDTDVDRAETLLEFASGAIQREARQLIEPGLSTITILGLGDQEIALPERPVTKILAVTIDEQETTDYRLLGDVLLADQGWPAGATVTVEYEHGFDPIPLAVTVVCVEMVARVWTNPANVIQQSLGSAQVYFDQNPPTGLLPSVDERRVIHDIFRAGVGSVRLR
jgi:hypothetical protein